MRMLLLIGFLLAESPGGCRRDVESPPKPGQSLAVRGTLAIGPECPEVHTASGRRYSLAGSIGTYRPGDQVCVKGTVAEMSFCMAGEATITVTSIGPANDCP
jgi:hypothetical protein